MKVFIERYTTGEAARGWMRGLVVSLAAAAFLTVSEAFGTGEAPLGVRAGYWLFLMFAGYLFGAFVSRAVFRDVRRQRWPLWLRVVTASVLMAVPFSGVVWAGSRLFLNARIPLEAWPVLFVSVLSVTLVVTAINMLVEAGQAGITHAAAAPPRFLERLPLKLRGAEVWAVEAEDHYLRLHTSRGQDLILMRLADAVAELEGIEGARVHRSWWVARDAIVEARRGDGRATLTLKDGSEVPVSRSYAGRLRDQGWI